MEGEQASLLKRDAQVTRKVVKEGASQAAVVGAFILLWFVVSISTIFLNKWLFGVFDGGFPYPVMVCCVNHVFMATLARVVMSARGAAVRPIPADLWLKVLVPIAICTAADVVCSNESLERLSVSFHTMIKASGPMWVLLFSFLFGLERAEGHLVVSVVLVSVGIACTAMGEISFDALGFLLGLGAIMLGAFRWALTQTVLQPVNSILRREGGTHALSVLEVMAHLAPIIAMVTLPASLTLEFGAFTSSTFFRSPTMLAKLLLIITIQSSLIFGLMCVEYLLVQRTSVITLSVAGVLKELLTIVLAVIIWGDRLTLVNLAGFAVCLAGVGLYISVKYRRLVKSERSEFGDSQPTTAV